MRKMKIKKAYINNVKAIYFPLLCSVMVWNTHIVVYFCMFEC